MDFVDTSGAGKALKRIGVIATVAKNFMMIDKMLCLGTGDVFRSA